uniref:non-specific serine/threonine protein kinase n=1 Tax=Astyanax mexicanus TaxID=7994 RepID=A0A8B9GM68_ASTMX
SVKKKEAKKTAKSKDLSSLGYNVLYTIGKGTFGTVKLAKSKKYPDKVAIKIMDPKHMSSYAYQQCMRHELPILRNYSHPHIVHVHEIYVRPSGQIFIVMEAAEMEIPPDQARLWFLQLVSPMVYLHNRNIAHRDLKCGNVLLTADDQVRLNDFGGRRTSADCSRLRCSSEENQEDVQEEIYEPQLLL